MQDTMNNIVTARNIHKSFANHQVLKGIDLDVKLGQVIALIGASGSGKSTLLRCLNHLELIDEGEIKIADAYLAQSKDGQVIYPSEADIRALCIQMGMVFQHFNLFPHKTVLENIIEAPIHVKKTAKIQAIELGKSMLDKVGLIDKLNYYPSQLSGGQKQRVAIARALAMQPKIMLFDEPTSALDPVLTNEVLKTMRQLASEKMTMIIVTHEMNFAQEIADEVIYMDGGIIIESGKAQQIFENPEQAKTKAFIQQLSA